MAELQDNVTRPSPDDESSPEGEVMGVDDPGEKSPEDERVAELLARTIDVPVLAEAVEQQEAADAADTLEDLEEDEAAGVLELMDEQVAAQALAEMENPLAAMVLDDLLDENNAELAGRLLELMAPDDAADLLQTIDKESQEEVYQAMPPAEAVQLRRLAGYAEDTAAGLMTTEFLAFHDDMTVSDATAALRASRIPEEVHHLPVVDQAGRLTGIIGLRALLLSSADRRIDDLMDREIKAVRANLDREAVAMEFDRYDYFMMPVIDRADRLLGIVTVDDVIDIIRREQTEDVQKTVGAGGEEAVYSRLREKFKGRFPWLAISLVLTCVAAIVVIFAEDMIRNQPILAFLMPVIAALVGNAGHQALAVTLRGIVLDEVRRERVLPLVLREAMVGLIQGCLLGVLMFLFVCFLGLFTAGASWQVALVAAIALALAMGVGTLAGSGIPLLMRSAGRDPAQSSAILLIFITDLLAFSTLLGLTHLSGFWLLHEPGAI